MTAVSTVLLVVPVFFVGWLLSRYPALEWHWFPLGWDSWQARILPVLTLALAPIGYIARLVRASVVETLDEDHVRTARAKGLRRDRIVLVHVVRNSLVPVLSAVVPMLALLITGAFFEEAFGIPGASGARRRRVLLRHIFPNTVGILVVAVLLELPGVILGEAFLSVLGLGPNPPTATWGNMAVEGIRFHRIWNVALPCAAIALFAVLANLLADRLQTAIDPRQAEAAPDG